MPANSQQCLNDSIIDTERSHSEITGYSPLGFGHCCLGKARLTLSYQPTSACGGILWSHVYRKVQCTRGGKGDKEKEERQPWRVRWDTQTLTLKRKNTHQCPWVCGGSAINVISSSLWRESCLLQMSAVTSQLTLESSPAFPPHCATVRGQQQPFWLSIITPSEGWKSRQTILTSVEIYLQKPAEANA